MNLSEKNNAIKKKTRMVTGRIGESFEHLKTIHFQVGIRSFPNKRILETIHETPACVKGITIEYYIF